ncbi:hypothetical protein [Pedobacter sp. NJ-S-72]
MKKLLLLVPMCASMLLSCKPGKPNIDPRQKDQLLFIHKIDQLDQKFSEKDSVTDQELVNTMKELCTFTKDSLNASFNNWAAEVTEIEKAPDGKVVRCMIRKDLFKKKKYPEYSSIIFLNYVYASDKKLTEKIKNIKVRDTILISGAFRCEKNMIYVTRKPDFVNDDSASSKTRDLFKNPRLAVKVSDITAVHIKR